MKKQSNIGISVPSNFVGGPQKLAALAARDFAASGHNVTIFVPVLPYTYYFLKLLKRPLKWGHVSFPFFFKWILKRRFSHEDLLCGKGLHHLINVAPVLIKASNRRCKKLDYLIYFTEAQIMDYHGIMPVEKQILLLCHPAEHAYGHGKLFAEMRRAFGGKTITISKFSSEGASGSPGNIPIVECPVSPEIWLSHESMEFETDRKDILLFLKGRPGDHDGIELVKKMAAVHPKLKFTVWCRGSGAAQTAAREFPDVQIIQNIPEDELNVLYSGHKFLVFPSDFEGFGMPPIEAMACGSVPILRSAVGAAEMYARDGTNSIFWEDDLDSLGRRVLSVMNNKDKLKKMQRATQHSLAKFNPRGYGGRLMAAAGFWNGDCLPENKE